MAAARDVVVRFLGNASGLNHAADQGGAAVSRFSDRTQKMATAGLAAVAGFGAGMVAVLKGGVEGLQEGEEAEAKFAQAISKVPAKLKLSEDAIKSYAETVQAKTRFSYEDALATSGFLAAQDGVQKALRDGVIDVEHLTEVSLNLATVQGKDGPAAAAQLAKWLAAPEKATGALRKAGISLTAAEQEKIKAWTKAGNVAAAQTLILAKVEAKTKGAAEAAGQTTAGQLERANAAWGEVQETLAVQIIPVITKLVGWLLKVTTWAQNNPEKVKLAVIVLGSLAAVIGTISLAIKAWTFITKVHTAVMTALNVVMFANPVVLITAAIIALIAVVVLIATKTKWFQQIWGVAWGAIKEAAVAAWNWIRDAAARVWAYLKLAVEAYLGLWRTIFTTIRDVAVAAWNRVRDTAQAAWNALKAGVTAVKDWVVGRFTDVRDFVVGVGQRITGAFARVWDAIRDGATAVKDFVVDRFTNLISFYTDLPGRIAHVTAGLFDGIKEAFRSAINWIIGAWNGLEFRIPGFDPPGPGPKFGGFTLGVPDITPLARGGTVLGGGWALVGEKGPEFLNLGRGAQVRPLDNGPTGPLTVEIHATGPTLQDIVRVEVRELNRKTRSAVLAGARRAIV